MTAERTRRRILVVDDDEVIRDLVTLSLQRGPGWEVLAASSGTGALAAAAASPPDAILLDLLMPEMDGLATLAALRAQPATREIPVVFLTGKAGGAELERLPELGAAGVIVKPFDIWELPAQIARIVAWDRPSSEGRVS